MGRKVDTEDAVLELARRQGGVVTRAQLLGLGLGTDAITARLRSCRLIRLYQGVYALGHDALSQAGLWWAAVLASGDGAALGATAAAKAWEIRTLVPHVVDVIVPTSAGRRRRSGIRLVRSATLSADEVTIHPRTGIPITTVARTLLDLAAVVSSADLRRACSEATVRRLATPAQLERVARRPRPGAHRVRQLVAEIEEHGVTLIRSNLEALMLELCARGRLPRPQVNKRRDGREIDFFWPDHDLVVEVDSWRWHQGSQRFVSDRARNRRHTIAGRRVVSYADYDLVHRPDTVIAELRRLTR